MCWDLFVGTVPISVLPILCTECLASPENVDLEKQPELFH